MSFLGKLSLRRGGGAAAEDRWIEDVRSSLLEVGRDLLTIEINTVIKAGMTARKMPELPHAILDIARGYQLWLRDHGGAVAPDPPRLDPPRLDPAGLDPPRLDPATFAALADAADAATKRGDMPAGQQVILLRIHRNCKEMIELLGVLAKRSQWKGYLGEDRSGVCRLLLERPRPPGAPSAEVNFLRKAWDIGTETVLVQTLVQLDGDVITRVAPEVLADERRPLFAIHNDGVGHAMRYWEAIFTVLRSLIGLSRASRGAAPAARPDAP